MVLKEKHIHKFKRLRYKSGNEIFFCVLPDCNKKMNPPLALGKYTICWRCGETFIMTEYSLRLAKPHCNACHKPKVKLGEESVPYHNIEASTELWDGTKSLSERLQKTIQPEEDL